MFDGMRGEGFEERFTVTVSKDIPSIEITNSHQIGILRFKGTRLRGRSFLPPFSHQQHPSQYTAINEPV